MKNFFTFVIAIATIPFTPQAQNTWTQKADFAGENTSGSVGFSIGDKGYIGLGGSFPEYSKDFWEYDPSADTWTQKADFGGSARRWSVGFSIGTKGYVGTGEANTGNGNDFWEYDQSTNSWTQKASFPGAPRIVAVGFSIEDKGYIGTGNRQQCCFLFLKDFWEYDPFTDTWTQKAAFGGKPRLLAVGFSIGSKGYIGLGSIGDFNSDKKDFWEYDPSTDAWTQKANFGGAAREDAIGFSIGNKGYIGTGYINDYDSPSILSDFWEYDPITNTWIQKADAGGGARQRAIGFSINDKGYIGLGSNNFSDLFDFWEYTPSSCTPPPAFITPLGNLDICDTGFVKLKANSGDSFLYQWSRNGVTITGATQKLFKAKKAGKYRVEITSSEGCSAVSEQVTVYSSCKLSEEEEFISILNLFPNPNVGAFTLDLKLKDEENASAIITITDVLGKQMIKQESSITQGKLNKEILLNEQFTAGLYVIHVKVGDAVFTQPLIIRR